MAGVRKTRQDIAKNIVKAEELPVSDLPTVRDVLAKMVFDRDKHKMESNKNVEVKVLAESLIPEIKALYRKVNSNLVVNGDKTILKKLIHDYKLMKDLERSGQSGKKRQDFEVKLGKLFDIVNCKCQILNCEEFPHCEGCMVRAHSFCECDDDQKIPEVELIYVLDQRSRQDGSEGKYQMGGKNNKDIENMIEEEHGEKVKSDKKLKKKEASEKLKVK